MERLLHKGSLRCYFESSWDPKCQVLACTFRALSLPIMKRNYRTTVPPHSSQLSDFAAVGPPLYPTLNRPKSRFEYKGYKSSPGCWGYAVPCGH